MAWQNLAKDLAEEFDSFPKMITYKEHEGYSVQGNYFVSDEERTAQIELKRREAYQALCARPKRLPLTRARTEVIEESAASRAWRMARERKRSTKPKGVACVEYVPILYCGVFEGQAVEEALHELRRNGSKIAPGFMNPEGIVLRFNVNGVIYKAFCEDDGLPKGVSPDNPY